MLAVALRDRVRGVDLGTVRDDEAELEQVLRSAAADYDVVVSSGSVDGRLRRSESGAWPYR